jgi:ubiquinone/menaquinone biosynthesis C-methylase UbiE
MSAKKAYLGSQLVGTYDARHFGGAGGQYVFNKDITILEKLCGSQPGMILDIPCGTGIYTAYFQAKGFRSIGIDIAQPMLMKAKERKQELRLVVGDILNLPVEVQLINTILIIRLFQHLTMADTLKALQELRRVMKPQGRIIFDTLSWSPRKTDRESYTGIHVYSMSDVEALIDQSGLKKIESRSAYLFSAIWYRKLPVWVLQMFDRVERLTPSTLLLRTFWACTPK